jgi:hypothetical protein
MLTTVFADDPERNTEFNYKDMKRRDRRRWERADLDKDDKLTKDELTSFLHPEEIDHMKDIMVEETMEDIDKDKDGKISLDEYIGNYTTIHINQAISLVLVRALLECRSPMTSHNNKTFFSEQFSYH